MTSARHPLFGTGLPSTWQVLTVNDIKAPEPSSCVAGPFGSNISSKYFVDRGLPVIRGSNLRADLTRFVPEGFVFVSEERARAYSPQHVRGGDLVFTCWGTVGQVGLIPNDGPYPEYIISNKQLKLRADSKRADSEYLFYFFASPEMVQYVRARAIGAAVPGINLGILKALPVVLPPLRTQLRMVEILSAYDDLIENCERRIRVLDEMARALYREWFVNFRYPGHEKTPLVDSPLGRIPKSWRVGRFGDLAKLHREGIDPGQFPEELFAHFSIPAFDERGMPAIERGDTIHSMKHLMDGTCVLLSKLNPRIPRVWLPYPGGDLRSITSTEFLVLKPAPSFTREFLHAHCISEAFAGAFGGLAIGTSTSHQRVKPDSLLALKAVLPDAAVVARCTHVLSSTFRLAQGLRLERHNLRKTRDLLLPRLLSGQLSVDDAA